MTMAFFEAAFAASERPLRLVEADPDLFAAVDAPVAQRAVRELVTAVLRVPPGRWPVPSDGEDGLGLLVLSGLLARTVAIAGQRRSELVGPGDLIRPWDAADELASLPTEITWDVLEPAKLAVLDDAFVRSACRLPGVLAALVARAVERSQRLAVQLAIGDVRRIDDRLLALFGQLGDRWGRVTPEGIHLPLRLTHELIAQLIGAKRPTVTTSLSELQRERRLVRRPDRTWLLPVGWATREALPWST
jgi:CRP/FNR family transcriptional regulator, cyclic AMP receptor protein